MTYPEVIEMLKLNGYKPIEGVERSENGCNTLWIQVEVGAFNIMSNVERIKVLLPGFLVRSLGSNSGVGKIEVKSK